MMNGGRSSTQKKDANKELQNQGEGKGTWEHTRREKRERCKKGSGTMNRNRAMRSSERGADSEIEKDEKGREDNVNTRGK